MYVPLRNHSHYSLLWSTNRCEQIIDKCVDQGHDSIGLTDIHSISGAIRFIQKCQKKNVKPIIGCDIFLGDSYLTLICLNNQGWHELLKLISRSNDDDHFKNVAQIDFDSLVEIITPDNFACVDGYIGSQFHHSQDRNSYVSQMKEKFNNYFLEIDKISNSEYLEVLEDLKKSIQEIDPQENFTIPCTSTNYANREDHIDHKLLMCVQLKTTYKKLLEKAEDIEYLKFLRNNTYYIKSPEEIEEHYSEKSIQNLKKISDLCSPLDVLSKPLLPHFDCPKGLTENEYLKELCREGWRSLIGPVIDKSLHEKYKDRVLEELGIIEKANLAGYFLIVQDYVNHFKKDGCLVGPSRGSAGGSLVSYLIGITLIDPIKYDLLFSRFYNEGRNTEDHVALPDIDVDFPPDRREDVIEYLNEKYGKENVCQMVTFGRLAGRSILKEVMRVNESCSFDQMNTITSKIPQEASISDLLENMENPSVIRWVLENDRESLIDYCWINDEGDLEGDFANVFKQALRMEGIYRTQGKHAAGVVIGSNPIDTLCPMIRSKNDVKIAAFEMKDLEASGGVKFDILGVSALRKCYETIQEINK